MPMIPVILSGGAGSRLWPVSRESHPKPFIRLADDRSLLQKTLLRAAALPSVDQILSVTNREFLFKTEDDYREVAAGERQRLQHSFLLEPMGRNTAAALHAAEQDPDTLLLVLPADHLIHDEAAFAQAVQRAAALAADGRLVTFGVTPEAPETGYGYIEADGHMVKRFVEKPDAATAQRFLEAGNFYWNSGMFCFRADAMVAEMRQHAPDILETVETCLREARRASGKGFEHIEFTLETFARVREDSIDYAVMEKSRQVAVVPCSIGWSDIGSWSALTDLQPADQHGNRVRGEALLHDVSNCAIQAEHDRLVGAVGVDNLVIVDTPDALLVAARDRVQDVRAPYTQLKRSAHPAHRLHRTVHRPWGTYTVLEEGPHFKIKRIVVKPGASLSLQMHHHRSERWIVVFGTASVVNAERQSFVRSNESTFIPPCTRHRLSNPGLVDLVLIEVQTGHYLGEDDIVRFQDAYGRNAASEPPFGPSTPARAASSASLH